MLFDHQNLGIDTSYVQIFTDNGRYMIQNNILGNGGTFAPVYHFRIIMIKVPPSRFLAKIFIFVLVPRNLIMSKVQRNYF